MWGEGAVSRTHLTWGRSYSTGGHQKLLLPPLHDEQAFNNMPPFYKMITTMINEGIQRFP